MDVIIADDHRLFAEGLAQLLRSEHFEVRGLVPSRDDIPDLLATYPQALLLVDLNMPGMSLPDLLIRMPELAPQSQVVVVTGERDWQLVQQLLVLGVHGVVLKEYSFDEIIHAIRSVRRGDKFLSSNLVEQVLQAGSDFQPLTSRQLQILRYVADGYPSKTIAARLDLHVKTIDNHRQNIMHKLNVRSAAEMVRVAKEHGLI